MGRVELTQDQIDSLRKDNRILRAQVRLLSKDNTILKKLLKYNKSQPLPWTKEKPIKPCVVVGRKKENDGWTYYPVMIASSLDYISGVNADEYLILEEL